MIPAWRPVGSTHFNTVLFLYSQKAGWSGENKLCPLWIPPLLLPRHFLSAWTKPLPLGRTLTSRMGPRMHCKEHNCLRPWGFYSEAAVHVAQWPWRASLLWWLGLCAGILTAIFPELICSAVLSRPTAFPISAMVAWRKFYCSVGSKSILISCPKSLWLSFQEKNPLLQLLSSIPTMWYLLLHISWC